MPANYSFDYTEVNLQGFLLYKLLSSKLAGLLCQVITYMLHLIHLFILQFSGLIYQIV